MRTIAEFVEDQPALDILRKVGVDFVQGYGVAMPFPLEELVERRRQLTCQSLGSTLGTCPAA
jgi:EAL domain-containing protein (putative c-di-GMP-specific phosphodiesterase class I)